MLEAAARIKRESYTEFLNRTQGSAALAATDTPLSCIAALRVQVILKLWQQVAHNVIFQKPETRWIYMPTLSVDGKFQARREIKGQVHKATLNWFMSPLVVVKGRQRLLQPITGWSTSIIITYGKRPN